MRDRRGNRREKKYSFSYYIYVFLLAAGVVLAAGFIVNIRDLGGFLPWIRSRAFVPFVVVYFAFSYLLITRKGRARKSENLRQGDFVLKMSEIVREKLGFSAEDFASLRDNEPFQDALHEAYRIHADGESEQYNIDDLSKRLPPGTKAAEVIDVIIDELSDKEEDGNEEETPGQEG